MEDNALEQTTQSHSNKEVKAILASFVILAILLKIVFYKETTIIVLKTVATISWLFVLPGYFISKIWQQDLNFTERLIICIPISAAIIGISSYYLGLLGLNLRIQSFILPPAIIFITLAKTKLFKLLK